MLQLSRGESIFPSVVLEILVLKDLGDLKVPGSYKAITLGASVEDTWAKPPAISQDVTLTGKSYQGSSGE